MSPFVARYFAGLVVVSVLNGCVDRAPKAVDSGQSASTAPPESPNVTNWDLDAGPLMVLAAYADAVTIVLPQATDSTASFEEVQPPQADFSVDLVGRAGNLASAVVVAPNPLPALGADCFAWPTGQLRTPRSGWRVGFERGRVTGVPLDSIEGKSSADSAALAASIARSVAELPSASTSDFRGLPYRVRSAHTFRTDSIDVVIADVVRSVNEEANPRLEHYFVIGERRANSEGRYRTAFFSRSGGAEDEIETTELLAVVLVGRERRPAAVVNVEFDEGGRLGLLERTAPGQWRFKWRSAYTGC